MMKNMVVAYLRGLDGKPKPKYIRGSLVEKEYNKGRDDRKKSLPNRYISDNTLKQKEVLSIFLFRYRRMDKDCEVEIEAENLNKALSKFNKTCREIQEVYGIVEIKK